MTLNLFQIGPAFVAGVAFYVSAYYIVLYIQVKRAKRLYLTFGLACIGIWLYDVGCLGLYLSSSVGEGASWQRYLFFIGPIITISLLWFFFDYTAYKQRKLGYFLALYFITTVIISIVGPTDLVLNIATPMIKTIQLTPSLQIVYYEVASGPLKTITQVTYVLTCLFCLWIAVKHYRLGKKKESRPLFIVLFVLAAGITNDVAIGSGIYTSIYLTEYAYLGIILLMASTLSSAIRAADRAKSEFLANMSHELRTPLNATLGFTEVLMEGLAGPVSPAQKEQLSIIYETNSNYLEIIDALINVADIDSGKSKIVIERFSLKDIVQSCLDSFKEKAAGKSISMKLEIDNSCPQEIYTDKNKITQVLHNLLDNAIKFTPEGGECGVIVGKRNKECLITVWDTGIGMSEENQIKLFQPLLQFESMLTKKYQGIGLGLYFSKRITEFIGGKIWVESKLNAGTRVNFTIP
ncbi:MAG TPA: ATP-binding protein [Candidatus Lokiarchaeia archaeon]|nr:ATP-binding protein [Candidatus Lokiarchaeia archaeon]